LLWGVVGGWPEECRGVDKRGVGDHLTVTFLGPVRLRAATGGESDGK
jgi:hypothetical protein